MHFFNLKYFFLIYFYFSERQIKLNYFLRQGMGLNSFGHQKTADRIEGIELLRKHENMPEGYKMEFEEILDDVQLKKLKILKMKYNAEKIQHKSTSLSTRDINSMAGDKKQMKKFEEDCEDDEDNIDSKHFFLFFIFL
jgi:hypothetical protein